MPYMVALFVSREKTALSAALALISISENWISIVEHVDCSPFDKLLGFGKRLVIRDSKICVLKCLVSFCHSEQMA